MWPAALSTSARQLCSMSRRYACASQHDLLEDPRIGTSRQFIWLLNKSTGMDRLVKNDRCPSLALFKVAVAGFRTTQELSHTEWWPCPAANIIRYVHCTLGANNGMIGLTPSL